MFCSFQFQIVFSVANKVVLHLKSRIVDALLALAMTSSITKKRLLSNPAAPVLLNHE
jgi:hypothetical protein